MAMFLLCLWQHFVACGLPSSAPLFTFIIFIAFRFKVLQIPWEHLNELILKKLDNLMSRKD